MKTIYGIKKAGFFAVPFVCFESYVDALEFVEIYDPEEGDGLIVPLKIIGNTHTAAQDALGDEIRRLSDKLAERDKDRGLNGKEGTE